ncbi:MAG TPA: SRPBCC domain-containing protein [Bryobacteraceae bacterium]|nr:SRPBCC domain-containing protein [Bryobacteraceae bacterium]
MSTPESESVRVTRRLAASPERVFEAWVDPALLRRWLAPDAEADARAGGRFRLEVSKPEGAHVVTGEYREFVPSERLVMTWVYEGPMAPAGKMDALLTVEFRKDGPNTEISLRHEGLTNPRYLETIRQGAWTQALDKLEALLANRPTS